MVSLHDVTEPLEKEAEAYGVYAANGAVIDLSAKSGDTIKIGTKAAAG